MSEDTKLVISKNGLSVDKEFLVDWSGIDTLQWHKDDSTMSIHVASVLIEMGIPHYGVTVTREEFVKAKSAHIGFLKHMIAENTATSTMAYSYGDYLELDYV